MRGIFCFLINSKTGKNVINYYTLLIISNGVDVLGASSNFEWNSMGILMSYDKIEREQIVFFGKFCYDK